MRIEEIMKANPYITLLKSGFLMDFWKTLIAEFFALTRPWLPYETKSRYTPSTTRIFSACTSLIHPALPTNNFLKYLYLANAVTTNLQDKIFTPKINIFFCQGINFITLFCLFQVITACRLCEITLLFDGMYTYLHIFLLFFLLGRYKENNTKIIK